MSMNLSLGLGLGSSTIGGVAVPSWVLSGAALDLNFGDSQGYNSYDRSKATPDEILTYTSPSPKMVYGDDGVLRYAQHNLALQSNTFDQSPWTLVNASLVSGQSDAFGGNKAWKLVGSVSASASHTIRQSITLVSGFSYRWRVIAKAGEKSWLAVDDGLAINAYFNLSAGTVGSSSGATPSIVDLGNGWYECSVSFVASGTGASMKYYAAHADGVASWVGDGVSGIYIFQGHFSRFPVDTTYVETTSAAAYSLPLDHDPVTHEALGVLIEEQRTNLLLQSNAMATSPWATANNVVVAPTRTNNSGTAPDGTNTATKVDFPAVSGAAYSTVTQAITPVGASVKVDSLWVKAYAAGDVGKQLYLQRGANTDGIAITLTADWQRVVTTGATSFNDAGIFFGVAGAGAGLTGGIDQSACSALVWGAQLEAGAFPTSYIPTVASQVTRAADQVSILTSAFGYSATAGTAVVVANPAQVSTSAYPASFDDGASNEMIGIRIVSSRWRLYVRDNSVDQSNIDAGSAQASVMVAAAAAWAADDFAISRNGASALTDGTGTLPTVTKLNVGRVSAGDVLNGHIKRLTYFPTRKSNAELQALAA